MSVILQTGQERGAPGSAGGRGNLNNLNSVFLGTQEVQGATSLQGNNGRKLDIEKNKTEIIPTVKPGQVWRHKKLNVNNISNHILIL